MLGRLTGRPLPPLAGLGLRLAGEAGRGPEEGEGEGEGEGGGWGEPRDPPGLGLAVFRLVLLRPRPIDILAESERWKPSRGVVGALSRGEGV